MVGHSFSGAPLICEHLEDHTLPNLVCHSVSLPLNMCRSVCMTANGMLCQDENVIRMRGYRATHSHMTAEFPLEIGSGTCKSNITLHSSVDRNQPLKNANLPFNSFGGGGFMGNCRAGFLR
jgi:hypothetical protein